MAKRNEWEFEYSATDLATAAKKQQEFRLGRVLWWTTAKEGVMHEIKDSGLEVSESLAVGTSNYAGKQLRGPQVLVRADLQEKLSECHMKIQTHQRAADEYGAWATLLVEHASARLKISAEDWRYFFGKGE